MRIRHIIIITVLVFLLGIPIIFYTLKNAPDTQLDITIINDIVNTLSDNWEQIQAGVGTPVFEYELNYVVIDNSGKLLAASRRDLNENINDAIRNRDTIVDILVNKNIVGKVIFYNDITKTFEEYRTHLVSCTVFILVILTLIFSLYALYLHRNLLYPFSKFKDFARRIAAGNLDIPLEMDKNNLFGAFTESFDLMRDELNKARENERRAERSKKELVASLSHDIKTPVASIKAVSELMLVKAKDDKEKRQLDSIYMKAEQINSLITNMFHATLEELQELNVTVTELHSTIIQGLIKNADYAGRVKPFDIPSCLVLTDSLRLQQVFDNIIGNSYKYAGTDIEVHAVLDESFMIIDIIDHGAGVPEDDLPLLLNKFYRGSNADGKSGYGLGLYISSYLLEQMSGELQCKNYLDGLSVRLMLRLA